VTDAKQDATWTLSGDRAALVPKFSLSGGTGDGGRTHGGATLGGELRVASTIMSLTRRTSGG
jgi:hypothetical protein